MEMIRRASAADAPAIAAIYNHYIRETTATFEEHSIESADVVARLSELQSASLPWLVCEQEGETAAYAYAAKWKGRAAYRYSVETSVYVAPQLTGRGIGTRLYRQLLADLRGLHLHVAIGGIALPNSASVALHENLGFRKVAQFSEVGFKFGRWIDVGYWQMSL